MSTVEFGKHVKAVTQQKLQDNNLCDRTTTSAVSAEIPPSPPFISLFSPPLWLCVLMSEPFRGAPIREARCGKGYEEIVATFPASLPPPFSSPAALFPDELQQFTLQLQPKHTGTHLSDRFLRKQKSAGSCH